MSHHFPRNLHLLCTIHQWLVGRVRNSVMEGLSRAVTSAPRYDFNLERRWCRILTTLFLVFDEALLTWFAPTLNGWCPLFMTSKVRRVLEAVMTKSYYNSKLVYTSSPF
jgi:hypothetical protein